MSATRKGKGKTGGAHKEPLESMAERAARAAQNEADSWVDALDTASFADTHGITEEEAAMAIALLRMWIRDGNSKKGGT